MSVETLLLIFYIVFITIITIAYEVRLSKLRNANKEKAIYISKLIENGNDLILSYKALVSIIRDTLTEDELEELFSKRRKSIIKESEEI